MKQALNRKCGLFWAIVALVLSLGGAGIATGEETIARQWNEELLDAIRIDFARPTVHARNLFHTAIAMWDAWAVYDPLNSNTLLHHEQVDTHELLSVEAARRETLSFACYRILSYRFAESPGAKISLPSFDAKMDALGYDRKNVSTVGNSPAARGKPHRRDHLDRRRLRSLQRGKRLREPVLPAGE